MGLLGHVARMGRREMCGGLVWKPEANIRLEDVDVDGRIIVKLILKKYNWTAWTEFVLLKAERAVVNTVMDLPVP